MDNTKLNIFLNYIKSYDKKSSPDKIDSKEEYELLGKYLNRGHGATPSLDDYLDIFILTTKDSQELLKEMDKLGDEYGKFDYIFAQDKKIDNDNVKDYLLRYRDLMEYTNDTEGQKLFRDKINGFLKEMHIQKIKDDNSNMYDSWEKLFDKIDPQPKTTVSKKERKIELEKLDETLFKEFLDKYYNQNFKITYDNDRELNNLYESTKSYTGKNKELAKTVKNILEKEIVNAAKVIPFKKEFTIKDFRKLFRQGWSVPKMSLLWDYESNQKGKAIEEIMNTPYDKNYLQYSLDKYIQDNKVPELKEIPDNVDLGNGEFDKTSTQLDDNCWIHAGINSLLSTPKGADLVKNNIYRDEKTGMFAVHLQEAEYEGLHEGIFYISPKEIVEANEFFATGEGDISAYIVAINKYFNEIMTKREEQQKQMSLFARWMSQNGDARYYLQGNSGIRFYEIMTGVPTTAPDAVEALGKCKIHKGIAVEVLSDADELYQMIEKNEGAIVISLLEYEHAISVVGVKDGKFLVQESNNAEDIFDGDKRFKKHLEKINNRYTYEISKKDLKTFGNICYMKWH